MMALRRARRVKINAVELIGEMGLCVEDAFLASSASVEKKIEL